MIRFLRRRNRWTVAIAAVIGLAGMLGVSGGAAPSFAGKLPGGVFGSLFEIGLPAGGVMCIVGMAATPEP
jgi:hypothetical protein